VLAAAIVAVGFSEARPAHSPPYVNLRTYFGQQGAVAGQI